MYGMKFFASVFITILMAASVVAAQGPARGRIEPPRDPAMEMTAKHNLEVARWYITRRKAYEGALDRLKEIIETYPDFSRIDEVVFLMGEAHMKMSKPEAAADYYRKLLKDYPGSEFAKKARERLDKLKEESGIEGHDPAEETNKHGDNPPPKDARPFVQNLN